MECFEANSYDDFFKIITQATIANIQSYVVHDAGRTQVERMAGTVCAVGPC